MAPLLKSLSEVREDFDRIALASAFDDDAAQPYDRTLLELIPRNCRRLLDVGCGTGRLARAAARRVHDVTAVDCSPEMLRLARQRSAAHGNILFLDADILDVVSTLGTFDCVISINTFHHLPIEEAARIMKAAVAPEGVLIVHDVRRTAGIFDRILDGPRLAYKALWRLGRVNRVRAFFEQRAAWAHHARGEVIASKPEIRRMRDEYFRGATLTQHFLWRYTLVWRNTGAGNCRSVPLTLPARRRSAAGV